jgi:hypothetical protein
MIDTMKEMNPTLGRQRWHISKGEKKGHLHKWHWGTTQLRGAYQDHLFHSYDILGARMLWKPKEARKFVKIHKKLLKFVKIRTEECFDKVLYHVNSRILK